MISLSFLDRYHEPIESYLTILSVDIDIEAGRNEIRIDAEGELDHEDAAFVFTTYTMGVVTVSCRYSIMMREVPGDVYPPIRGKRYVITGSLHKEIDYDDYRTIAHSRIQPASPCANLRVDASLACHKKGGKMTPHEYQQFALSTYCAPGHIDRTDYLHHLLIEEVGEVMSLFAKSMRDGHEVDRGRLVSELGDVLWCVACLEGWSFWYHPPYYSAHEPIARVVGDLMCDPDIVCLLSLIGYCSLRSGYALTLEEIAIANVAKLTSRRDRGVLKGSGDDR